jgi:hypothetical protein
MTDDKKFSELWGSALPKRVIDEPVEAIAALPACNRVITFALAQYESAAEVTIQNVESIALPEEEAGKAELQTEECGIPGMLMGTMRQKRSTLEMHAEHKRAVESVRGNIVTALLADHQFRTMMCCEAMQSVYGKNICDPAEHLPCLTKDHRGDGQDENTGEAETQQ